MQDPFPKYYSTRIWKLPTKIITYQLTVTYLSGLLYYYGNRPHEWPAAGDNAMKISVAIVWMRNLYGCPYSAKTFTSTSLSCVDVITCMLAGNRDVPHFSETKYWIRLYSIQPLSLFGRTIRAVSIRYHISLISCHSDHVDENFPFTAVNNQTALPDIDGQLKNQPTIVIENCLEKLIIFIVLNGG